MTRADRKKSSPLKIPVIIVAIIVVIIFVAAGNKIHESAQGYPSEYDARDYIYSAEQGRFGNLYETAVHDMAKTAEYSPEVVEYRALAFYYEQAVLEHAYRFTGDDAKADEFAIRMAEYEAQLGSMASKTEAVHKAVAG